MKKIFTFFAATLLSVSMFAQATAPDAAPAAPTQDEANVMALYCNHYAVNTIDFNVLGWGGVATWQTLEISGTKILACTDMKWEAMTNWGADHYDVSAYETLHADIWAPADAKIKLTFEALGAGDGGSGYKQGVVFELKAGWNAIDADLSEWPNDYDFADVRYLILEGYQTPAGESFENNPLAFTNIYFYKEAGDPEVELDLVKLGINFPTENRPAENNIEMAGTFAEGTMAMEKIDTGWFLNYDFVNAAEDDTFKFRDKTNPNMVLCQYIPANGGGEGKWVQAIITFGDYWSDDTYKGTPCKMIELDLSNGSVYAWKEGMPEPDPDTAVEDITVGSKSVKVIRDGQVYILRGDKTFNILGAEVR